ncbi:MAG: MotA/TolQ/ExbB proton channel family protein, partial [Desulfovibrionaceae bacterium]
GARRPPVSGPAPELFARLGEYFVSGGLVMVPLAGVSVAAWTLILVKTWQLAAWRRRERPAREAAARALAGPECGPDHGTKGGPERGRPHGADRMADPDRADWQAALARAFLAGAGPGSGPAPGPAPGLAPGMDPDLDGRRLRLAARPLLDAAERHVGTILVLAGLAPLLGLLGTVMGMIGVFDTLAVLGAGDPKALSGGISEALVSTQTGLLVAIPALMAGHFLRRRARTFQARVERFCAVLARTAAGQAGQDRTQGHGTPGPAAGQRRAACANPAGQIEQAGQIGQAGEIRQAAGAAGGRS